MLHITHLIGNRNSLTIREIIGINSVNAMGNESSSQKNKNAADKNKQQPLTRSQTQPNVQEIIIDFPPLKHGTFRGTKTDNKTPQPSTSQTETTNSNAAVKDSRKTGVPEDLKMAIENWKLVTPEHKEGEKHPELKLEQEGAKPVPHRTNQSIHMSIRGFSLSFIANFFKIALIHMLLYQKTLLTMTPNIKPLQLDQIPRVT